MHPKINLVVTFLRLRETNENGVHRVKLETKLRNTVLKLLTKLFVYGFNSTVLTKTLIL